MAYTLQYSLGTLTVADTTINSQTSLNLPGRNYAGYGAPVDQNQLSILENFASFPTVGPVNPIPGQTWYDTAVGSLNINTSSTSIPNWTEILINSSSSNISAANVTISGTLTTDDITTGSSTTPGTMTGAWSLTSGSTFDMGTSPLTAVDITTGSSTTPGVMTGAWSLSPGSTFDMGASPLTTVDITTGSPTTPGVMTGAWSLSPGSTFDLGANPLSTTNITTGAVGTPGTMTGQWTLTAGSTLNATYADLAERFESDGEYDAGTVMEMGGDKEITAVRDDASENVLGVISASAGLVMNGAAGTQKTHPTIAMTGRVPVKVSGIIKKGDRLISAGSGRARAAKTGEANSFNTIGRSLENKLVDGDGLVLAAVSAKL